MGGLGSNDAIDVYEEVKFEPNVMVDLVSPTLTLSGAQLEDGDILVFQPRPTQVRGGGGAGAAAVAAAVMSGATGCQLPADGKQLGWRPAPVPPARLVLCR